MECGASADGAGRGADLPGARFATYRRRNVRNDGGNGAARGADGVFDAAARCLSAPAAIDGTRLRACASARQARRRARASAWQPTRMTSLEAIREIVRAAGDAPIIASLGHPAYDLFAAGDRPGNFYTWGSMGLASSIGLGLALAQPRQHVHVLDGDGSLLMNLGALATIGWKRPANFVLLVLDNERYATTGNQDTATAHGADLEAAARALGFASAVTVRSADALAESLA